MVTTRLVDTIRDPSRVIIDLYDEDRGSEADFPAHVASHFAAVFHTQDAIQQVSLLNAIPSAAQRSGLNERYHHSLSTILQILIPIGPWFVFVQ